MNKVTKKDVKKMLNIDEDLDSLNKVDEYNLSYNKLSGAVLERELINAIERIQQDTQIVGTPERTDTWENGWKENLREFEQKLDIEALMPKYFRPNIPFRFKGNYIKSSNPRFEYELGNVLKQCLYELYAADVDDIYEFGCGTGYNLVQMGEMFPDKHLHGFDLTESGIRILQLLHDNKGVDVDGRTFDFTNPDQSVNLKSNSMVFTSAALEQVGENSKKFIDFLLMNEFKCCVHLEPIVELYDENNLLDYLALTFHNKRHYLRGLLPYLQQLDNNGKIVIDKVQRTHLGNFNHEGYTLIVWHKKV